MEAGEKKQALPPAARGVFLAAGIVFMALAGALFSCSEIGMDPLSVLYGGIASVLHIRLGTSALLTGAAVLALLIFRDRKRIGAGTVAVALAIGPLLNLSLDLLPLRPAGWPAQAAVSLMGAAAYSVGMGLYLYADLGCGPIDALMMHFLERTSIRLRAFKVLFDIACVAAGWAMGGSVGAGTLIAAFLTGPMMCAVMKGLDSFRGMFRRKRKEAVFK